MTLTESRGSLSVIFVFAGGMLLICGQTAGMSRKFAAETYDDFRERTYYACSEIEKRNESR